ncbi:methylmalonyl-CoA mutase C-terminal domain/subunit [Caldalkalibacillus uzonensis]|uniref:Methylmalonyl-CoA mutase C-terminal domain/subunit n=1 Tax=Caldalkalibacillus uzonensis TaxID=353224 RepID=A0ABU0CRP2_9BACI|nr:methylmalonyl-CoA epimerase [Caldalkalibacillus uzonensis]MDQ0337697.1 methylmalonyl-CoA mutase C-terminal domain/subunit [Caldalkalibacillus uzonensis]
METIRVLIAKPGLDGHDRGALVIAQALRDQGMEVIYTGLRQSPEQIVASAIQEDVDCIGLSCLSGAHNELFPEVVRLLQEQGADDMLVIGGGVIPAEDIPYLESQGIARVFTPGTPTKDIADFIRFALKERKGEQQVAPPKKIAHIGIAVKSIEEALPFYQQQLGLPLEGIETVESEQVRVAFLKAGETRLELLESLSPDGPIAKYIANKGEGIHHLALEVEDIEDRLKQLKENGVQLIHEQPKEGAHAAQIAFLHPKATGGVLLELCQYAQETEGD